MLAKLGVLTKCPLLVIRWWLHFLPIPKRLIYRHMFLFLYLKGTIWNNTQMPVSSPGLKIVSNWRFLCIVIRRRDKAVPVFNAAVLEREWGCPSVTELMILLSTWEILIRCWLNSLRGGPQCLFLLISGSDVWASLVFFILVFVGRPFLILGGMFRSSAAVWDIVPPFLHLNQLVFFWA